MAGVGSSSPSPSGAGYSLDDLNVVENLIWGKDYAGFSEALKPEQMSAITRVFKELGLPAQFRPDEDDQPRIQRPMLGAEEFKDKLKELRNRIKS